MTPEQIAAVERFRAVSRKPAPPLPVITNMRPDRDPDFIIGSPENPYMLRWWILPRNDVFNIYYHRILRDDDDRALHDHPWPSFSIMISGQLRETTPDGTRIIHAGECVYRGPDFAHRLELIDGEPAETLFITGPRVRDWGFHCPKGWVHWKDFVAENPGEVGRGCGEQVDAPASPVGAIVAVVMGVGE